MPLDPRIPLGVQQPQVASPLEAVSQFAQLQGLREQGEARRLAAEEARTKHLRQRQIDEAYEKAVRVNPETGEIDIDYPVLTAHLPGSLIPETVRQLKTDQKTALDIRTATMALAKAGREHLSSVADTIAASDYDPTVYGVQLHGLRDLNLLNNDMYTQLSQVTDPAQIKRIVDGYRAQTAKDEGFTLSPGQVRYGPGGKVIAEAPAKAEEETFTLSPGQVRYGPGGQVLASVPGAPRDERLVQVIGPNGQPIWVRESQAVGKPAAAGAAGAKPASAVERQRLAFYTRARAAEDTLSTTDAAGRSLEDRVGGLGLKLWSPLQTTDQQLYTQAQRAFTEARLRPESGAAIPEHEYENDRKTYFKQPGDSPAVIAQKRQAREQVLQGAAFSAGSAYDEYYGRPFTRETPAPPPPLGTTKGDPLAVTAPNGKTYRFNSAAEAAAFKKRAGIP